MIDSVNVCLIPGLSQVLSQALEIVREKETGPIFRKSGIERMGLKGTASK